MSTLYVAEYSGLAATEQSDSIPVVVAPPESEQTVAIGVGSAQSAAFGPTTKWVEVSADAVCSIAFGSDPTATAANLRLAANERKLFRVPQGAGYKVACIANT